MEGKTDKIQYLYKKYLSGTISPEEMEEILDYFKTHGVPPELEHLLMEEISRPSSDMSKDMHDMTDRVEKRLAKKLPRSGRRIIMKRFFPYAAAMLIALMAGVLFMNRQSSTPDTRLDIVEGSDIFPADEKATILLSDGRRISLDGNRDGIIIDGQQITYSDGSSSIVELSPAHLEHITIQTPRGGTYRVTLPDGTLVWMNAETTLRYPSKFSAKERVVNLEGEAYFSVQKHRSEAPQNGQTYMPFKVITPIQMVEVLGTEFNISAYADEKETKTTLVHGKVSVQTPNQSKAIVLYPGEQARTDQTHTHRIKVDVEDYIDWKNGEFVFRNETTQEVMLRIARWYDVELKYNSASFMDERFSGSISRYDQLNTVLDIMEEASDLHFEVNDRTVVIGKKRQKQITHQ